MRSLVYRVPNYPAGLGDGLKISFNGNDVHRLTRATVYVWNSGNQPITHADLSTKIPLAIKFPEEGFEILQTSVAEQTRAANNVRIEDDRLLFDYLNAGDGFVVDVFGNEPDEKLRVKASQISLTGDVVGIAGEAQQADFDFSSSRAPAYILTAFGLTICSLLIGDFFDMNSMVKLPPWIEYYGGILLKGLAGLFGAIFLIVGTSFLATKKVPPRLLTSGESASSNRRWPNRLLEGPQREAET